MDHYIENNLKLWENDYHSQIICPNRVSYLTDNHIEILEDYKRAK